MNVADAYRKLEAWAAGRPVPRGDTLHAPLVEGDAALLLAFVRMGGESSPWGVAWRKLSDAESTVVTVAEPRDPDALAQMVAQLAPALLEHLGHPEHVEAGAEELPHRQIWLPGATHLAMLHLLAYAYAGARKGPEDRVALLRKLGRAAGWLFRESQRPGQVRLVVASAALSEAFAFPAEDLRLEHLGYQLALLETEGDLATRLEAASFAEDRPVATSLAPRLEIDELKPRLKAFHDARRAGASADETLAAGGIGDVLEGELLRRLELTERAWRLLRDDPRPVNPGVDELVALSREEHLYQYLGPELRRLEDGDDEPPSSPETDWRSVSAASRYHAHVMSDQIRVRALVHRDRQMQIDMVLSGEAHAGKLVEVRDEGTTRATVPVWRIEDPGERPLRFREGSKVCVAGMPKRTGVVRSLEIAAGRRVVEVEIVGWKGGPRDNGGSVPPATSKALEGQAVILVEHVDERFARQKSFEVRDDTGPGAWLTHGGAEEVE